MKTCRFGIIGAGNIANHFCNAVKRIWDAEVAAVASTSAERAAAFAKKNGIERAYGSYEQMLQNEDINIVYIATTHNFHKENILLCLAHGKHVLCEKAMVLTAADAREVFAAAKKRGLFCMEAMWSRFLPQYQTARKWITSGRIGTVQSASVSIGFRADQNPAGRILNPNLAGGAMYDIGVYAIEIMTYLIGEPVTDCVGLWRAHPVTGVDERLSVILRFPSCDGVLQCAISGNAKEYVIVNGSNGVIEIPFVTGGHKLRLLDGDRNVAEEFEEDWENGFVYEIREVIRCIREGKTCSETMPPEATIECAEIFDKVLRS